MSSWDRSRNIPWSLIRQDGSDPDAYKEQVYKALQKQMMQEEDEEDAVNDLAQNKEIKVPFDTGELLKMAAFGGTIGSITGAVLDLWMACELRENQQFCKKPRVQQRHDI